MDSNPGLQQAQRAAEPPRSSHYTQQASTNLSKTTGLDPSLMASLSVPYMGPLAHPANPHEGRMPVSREQASDYLHSRTNQPMDLSILSAQVYDDSATVEALTKAIAAPKPLTIGGGWVFNEKNMSSRSPPGSPSASGSGQWKTVQAEQPDQAKQPAKNKRGRPRLDTKDESAADRRRTQIRLAQRAYRQRKETTITRLEQNVNSLQESVDKLNGLFQEYRQNKDAPAAYLEDIAQRFDATYNAAKSVTVENPNVPGDIQEEDEHADSAEESPSATRRPLTSQSPPVESPQRATAPPQAAPKRRRTSDPMSIEHINYVHLSHPRADVVLQHKVQRIFSFQEKNFGRRLHRAAYERAYHTLSMPLKNEEWIRRAFALTTALDQPHKLSTALKRVLESGEGSSLSMLHLPLIPLGGAGRHYPLADPDSDHPNAIASGPLLEKIANASQQLDLDCFGGTWFTPYEVSQYLVQKGYILDGQEVLAEVFPIETVPELTRSPTVSHISSPGASYDLGTNLGFPSYPPDLNTEKSQAQAKQQAVSNMLNLPGFNAEQLAPPPRAALLEVDRFIQMLTEKAVCLGRTPGFRLSDVEDALRACTSYDG